MPEHVTVCRWRAILGVALGVASGCESNTSIEGARDPNAILETRQAQLAAADDFSFVSPPVTPGDDCDITLTARGDMDADMIIEAVETSDSNTVVCLEPGEYVMNRSVVVSSVRNLTIKGLGATPQDTSLDFSGHVGDKGFDVTTPGFWIENLEIKNTIGNGVEVKAENEPDNPAVFRKLHVTWDAPGDENADCSEDDSRRQHGAYSVYPTLSSYVVVEFCEVEGASDAGLYVGSVEHGTVRHNRVHGNVAGIEVENSEDVVVYDNEAFENAGGMFALQEPGLARRQNTNVLLRDNRVYDNNGCNFAKPNTTVAAIPSGTGMMSLGGVSIEFRDNEVSGNGTAGLLIVSNVMQDLLADKEPDYPEGYDPFPQDIYLNGNDFSDNATQSPASPTGDLALLVGGFDDVVWDSFIAPEVTDSADARICLGESAPGFVNVTGGACADPASEEAFIGCVLEHTSKSTEHHTCTGEVDAEGA